MEVSIRVMYGFIVFLMIVWISGCSNKSGNVRRNSDYAVVKRLHSTSKFIWKKDIVRDKNISLKFVNKYPFTNSNRYTYDYTSKGSYSFCCYKVQPGDTLYYIAWITGNDYHVLAKNNNICANDILKVGQILDVGNVKNKLLNKKILKQSVNHHRLKRDVKTSPGLNVSVLDRHVRGGVYKNINSNLDASSNIRGKSSIFWSWPAIGKVIGTFSSSEGGNKGIDISGIIGQPVFSARSGKVVYAGNALFGYGNLIIIKHDNDFLSTYAHNDKVLVIEQQNVIVGQKIATMGNSGSDIVKLHFEIRYKGQSVDPLFYLPNKYDSSNKR